MIRKRKSEKPMKVNKVDADITWWHITGIFVMIVVFISLIGIENREKKLNERLESVETTVNSLITTLTTNLAAQTVANTVRIEYLDMTVNTLKNTICKHERKSLSI